MKYQINPELLTRYVLNMCTLEEIAVVSLAIKKDEEIRQTVSLLEEINDRGQLRCEDGDVPMASSAAASEGNLCDEPDFEGDFDRVKAERIESFFASERATRGELLRPSNDLTTEKLEAMKLKAISMVRDSLRFDSKYDLEDHSEVYCTELVYMLYQQAGIDLSEGRRTAVDVPLVHSICLLPEDIYRYSDNISYFKF